MKPTNDIGRERCLLIDFHHLGDAVMAFPAVRGLVLQYEVSVACLPGSKEVFELILPPERIITLEAPWGGNDRSGMRDVGKWLAWINEAAMRLRDYRFSASFSGWCDPRVDLLTCKAGIPMRAGLPAEAINYYVWRAFHLPSRLPRIQTFQFLARSLVGHSLLTHPVRRADYRQHHRDDWAQVVAEAGVTPDVSLPWFDCGGECGPKPEGYWLLHPGTGLEIKRWEMEKWSALRKSLLDSGTAPVKVIQGPGESLSGMEVPAEEVLAPDSVRGLVEVLAGARGLVCLDSFPAHLAAAMGVPVVSLFGRQNPCWYSPYGMEAGVVTVNDGRLDWGPPLLAEVTVERVMERVLRS